MHMPLSLIANVRAARNAQTETVHLGVAVRFGWAGEPDLGWGETPLPASFAARTLLIRPAGGRPQVLLISMSCMSSLKHTHWRPIVLQLANIDKTLCPSSQGDGLEIHWALPAWGSNPLGVAG